MLFHAVPKYDDLMRDLMMWGAMLSAEAMARYGRGTVLEAQRNNLITRHRLHDVTIYSARGRNLARHHYSESQKANLLAPNTILSALLLRLALRELGTEGVRLQPHAPVNSPAARHLAVSVGHEPSLVVISRVELPPRTLQHITNLYLTLTEFEHAQFVAYTLDPTLQERPQMLKKRRVELRLRAREQILKYPDSSTEKERPE